MRTRVDFFLLQVCQFDDFVDGSRETVNILTACLGEVRLTATTTLNELGSLANHLAGIQAMVADHVVAHHDRELGLVVVVGTDDAEQGTLDGSTNLEGQVLGTGRRHRHYTSDNLDTIHDAGLLHQSLGSTLDGLSLEAFYLLLHGVVLVDILLDDALQVLGIVEERLDVLENVLHLIETLLAVFACGGLDTTDAGSHTALRENLEETDATR